jgi:hypothetical protein
LSVFVIDRRKKPLMPCSEKRARLLLERGRAVAIKLDPGSKTTGIAVVVEVDNNVRVLSLMELQHRGKQISEALTSRRNMRRRRRGNLRYRPARFNNRTKPKGWLAPSLQHRVDTTLSWVKRLRRLVPITRIVSELVRFDMQMLEPRYCRGWLSARHPGWIRVA